MINPTLRALVDLRDRTLQKSRIAFSNRLYALDAQTDTDTKDEAVYQVVQRWYERFDELEDEAEKDIQFFAKKEPIIEEMVALRGIGLLLAAKVVALCDIEQSPTISSFWRYAGYGQFRYWMSGNEVVAPERGWQWKVDKLTGEKEKILVVPEPQEGWELVTRRDSPVSGWMLPYNKRLKTTLHVVAESFIRSGSPYRTIYDETKEYYLVNTHTEWTKGHAHNAATRKMIKMFLSHLWLRWRTLEGLPVRQPYVHEKMGHTTIRTPEEFGWLPR